MFSSLTHTETSFRVEDSDGNLPFPLGPHLFLGPNAPDRDYSSVSWLGAGRLLWTVARRKPGSLETVGDAGDIGFFCSPSSAQTSTPYPAFTSSSEQRGHLYNPQNSVKPRTFRAALGVTAFCGRQGLWRLLGLILQVLFSQDHVSDQGTVNSCHTLLYSDHSLLESPRSPVRSAVEKTEGP